MSSWAARAVAAAPSFQTCFACVHIYILYACVYTCVCVYVCGHDICIYMHVYMYLYICAFIHVCVCVCIFVHRLWVLVSVLQRVDGVCMRMCFRVHMHAYTYVCRYIYMCIFFCSKCYMHFTGVVGTSAWAGVYVTQVCFNTNVHICDTLAVGCVHMCIRIYVCICTHIIWMRMCVYDIA